MEQFYAIVTILTESVTRLYHDVVDGYAAVKTGAYN